MLLRQEVEQLTLTQLEVILKTSLQVLEGKIDAEAVNNI